jgi:3-hydroxyisobutyrate dehydrogenase-like beta-hydroxyacid dehydrogenase
MIRRMWRLRSGRFEGSLRAGREPGRMIGDSSDATVAILGLGEAGSLLARDLVRGGARVRGWDPDLHGDLSEIPLAASFAEAVRGADLVISVNWAVVACDVAREALPLLRSGTIYAEHNTAGPALKQEVAAIVAPSGARCVDVAMMAPVPGNGIRVPMFLAGDGADELAAFYRRFGTPVTVVGATPGEANARKLCRSVFFKGMSSAVWEALEAARAAGVEDWLRADITDTFVRADAQLLDRLVDGTAKHAKRRAHEMRDAAALLAELGVPATVAEATAISLERISSDKGGRTVVPAR